MAETEKGGFVRKLRKIFEYSQDETDRTTDADGLMTPDQKERGQYYIQELRLRQGELDPLIEEWNDIEELFACDTAPLEPDDPDYPNPFMPLLTPIIEGQVAAMTETGIKFTHKTRNPGQDVFMHMLDAAGSYCRNKNRFVPHFKDYTRNYEEFGNAVCAVMWEKELFTTPGNPDGFPRIMVPPLGSVIVDGRIKDYKDLQYAEYIIHVVGLHSIAWAKRTYGEDIGNAIETGGGDQEGYDPDVSTDDTRSFVLLHVWTRMNKQGNLQLIEMDSSGFVLRESDPSKPYYTYAHNEYPFFFSRMIPITGQFYGFGDGRMLRYLQDTLNRLVADLELACRYSSQGKTAIDPRGKANLKQWNSNPAKPFLIDNPNQNIRQLQGIGINNVVVTAIQLLLSEAQRITRFNNIMTGNMDTSSATATQINNQINQGSVGISDKMADIAAAMAWADLYCLKLCLQYWKTPMWIKLDTTYEWVDMTLMTKIAKAIPMTGKTQSRMLKNGISPDKIPNYEYLNSKDPKNLEAIDADVEVVIGKGIPSSEIERYNMISSMLQMQIPNPETGVLEGVISLRRARKILEDLTGLKLLTDEEEMDQNSPEPTPLPAVINPGEVNPATDNVQAPQTVPTNLASTVPGTGKADKRGMI